ncbi:hypothetical protein pb186bvf_017365 [Paramecium bursaria]
MSFPQQDYMAMLRARMANQYIMPQQYQPYTYQQMPRPPQTTQQYLYPQYVYPYQYPYNPYMMIQQFAQPPIAQAPVQTPPPQSPAPQQATKPNLENRHIHVDGTRVWLNVKMIKELPDISSSEEDILDYDEEKKRAVNVQAIATKKIPHQFQRTQKHVKRQISTRNVQVQEEPPLPIYSLFTKNNGYIRVGKGYQCEILNKPISKSFARKKLNFLRIWNHNRSAQYMQIKDLLGVSHNDVVRILSQYRDINKLIQRIQTKCPQITQEIKNLLKKQQQ